MLLLIAVACVIMGLYAMRLIFLQLVNGDDFKAKATNTTDYNFTVTAARGGVDSAGRRIATTATSYNVVLNKLLMGDRDLDAMLQQIVELLRENGESWNDTLLIGQPDAPPPPPLAFHMGPACLLVERELRDIMAQASLGQNGITDVVQDDDVIVHVDGQNGMGQTAQGIAQDDDTQFVRIHAQFFEREILDDGVIFAVP